jgi:hypothetical protein
MTHETFARVKIDALLAAQGCVTLDTNGPSTDPAPTGPWGHTARDFVDQFGRRGC